MAKDRAKVGCNPRHPRHTVGVFLKKGGTPRYPSHHRFNTQMVIHDLDDLGYPHFRNPPYIAKHQWMKNCRSSLCKLLALLPFPIQFCERTLNLNIHIKVLSLQHADFPLWCFYNSIFGCYPRGDPTLGTPQLLATQDLAHRSPWEPRSR